MKHSISAALVLTAFLAASPALADKPDWAGGDSMVIDAVEDLVR
jgi:hypothetical protein